MPHLPVTFNSRVVRLSAVLLTVALLLVFLAPPAMRSLRAGQSAAAAPMITGFKGIQQGQIVSGIIAIEALVTGDQITQVVFQIDGPRFAMRVENEGPYFFPGDQNGKPLGWDTRQFPDGDYMLTATVTNAARQQSIFALSFRITNNQQAQTANAFQQSKGPIISNFTGVRDGQTLSGSVMIGAPISGNDVEQVIFQLDGPRSGRRVEQKAPYFLAGDEDGRPFAWDTRQFPDGDYMLTAVSKNKAGERGVKSVRFRITNGAQSRAAPAPASASTQATALPPGPTPMGQLWSDPMTWGGMLPAEGAEVIVPVGQTIVMDVDPPPLRSLQIDGTLVFDNRDLSLQADWIMVHGRLEIGTAEQPFRHRATITMIGDDPSEDIMGMGSNVFGVMGGTLDIHGERRGPSWTRLAQTAEPGASWIELEQPVNWRPGDRIVIASTDFDPLQAEEMTVVSVIDTVVVLDKPLKYRHWGEAQEFSGMKIDTRAEVGLLSRNIVVQGAEASEETRFGGHMMIMQGSTARIDSAEFFRMGQLGEKGRYPVHFHMAGYMMGSYVNNNSIHHSHSRCLTIHGSHQVLVQNNVAYDTYGHCYFIEDGIETKNVLEGNLGLVTRQPPMENALLETDMAPATFWITNPDNIIRNNVAAGSQGHGFWYALPEHPTGPSATDQVTPREMGVMEFSGNVAHSNIKQMHDFGSGTGLRVDEHLDGRAVFEEFTGYKNQSFGMWMLYKPQITGARLADNRVGVLAIDGVVEDSLIVGLSDNSDPKVGVPIGPGDYLDAPLLGMMMYNGHIHTKRVAFVNFKDYKSPEGHMHHAGGVGLLESRDWNDYPLASIEGSRFVNATPVYLRPYIEAARDSTRTFVLEDRDGSVSGSGQPGSVVLNHPLQLTPECTPLAHNQTSVCPMQNRYVSFEMGNWDGEAPHMDMSPVNLTRDDGVSAAISSFVVPYPDGNGASGARAHLPANRNYAISTGITTPQHMSLSLHSGQMGDWMQLSIPYPHEKLFVYQDKNYGQPLPEAESLEALGMSQSSAYVLDNGTLHVKLVANSDFDVCAVEGCP